MATQNPTTQKLIGAKRVTAEYGIKYTSLRDLVFRGELPVLKIGRSWYFERSDIDAWIKARKERVA